LGKSPSQVTGADVEASIRSGATEKAANSMVACSKAASGDAAKLASCTTDTVTRRGHTSAGDSPAKTAVKAALGKADVTMQEVHQYIKKGAANSLKGRQAACMDAAGQDTTKIGACRQTSKVKLAEALGRVPATVSKEDFGEAQIEAATMGLQEAMEGCMASVEDLQAGNSTSGGGGRRLLGGALSALANATFEDMPAGPVANLTAKKQAQKACVTETAAKVLTQTMGVKPADKDDVDAMNAVAVAAAIGAVGTREACIAVASTAVAQGACNNETKVTRGVCLGPALIYICMPSSTCPGPQAKLAMMMGKDPGDLTEMHLAHAKERGEGESIAAKAVACQAAKTPCNFAQAREDIEGNPR